jgi:hypothetical protein
VTSTPRTRGNPDGGLGQAISRIHQRIEAETGAGAKPQGSSSSAIPSRVTPSSAAVSPTARPAVSLVWKISLEWPEELTRTN